jgi:hypothetical protein
MLGANRVTESTPQEVNRITDAILQNVDRINDTTMQKVRMSFLLFVKYELNSDNLEKNIQVLMRSVFYFTKQYAV